MAKKGDGFLNDAFRNVASAARPQKRKAPTPRSPFRAGPTTLQGAASRTPQSKRTAKKVATVQRQVQRTVAAPRKSVAQVRRETAARNRGRAPAPKGGGGLEALLRGGVASAAAAATGKDIERASGKAQAQVRRNRALQFYTQATQDQRRKMVSDATERARDGRDSERDRLVLDAHYRRQRQVEQGGAPARERAAAANLVNDTVATVRQGKAERDARVRKAEAAARAAKEKKGKGLLDKIGDVTGLGPLADVTIDVAEKGVSGIGKALRQSSLARVPGAGGKSMRAGAAADLPRAALLPAQVAVNVAKVAKDDPGQLPRAAGDMAAMVKDIPAGVIRAATDPLGAGKAIIADYKRRYGPLVAGREKEFRDRLKKEGIAPEVVDVIGSFSSGSTAAATTISGAAKATAKATKAGSKVNRAANAVERVIEAPRPKLKVAPGVAKEQRKAKGLGGIAVNRLVDNRRAARVKREAAEFAVARKPRAAAASKREARKIDRAQQPGKGQGIRGVAPDPGEVAPRLEFTRKRQLRKATAAVQSTGFRRMDRLANRLSRDAGRKFRALSKREQMAAVQALEGTINPADAAASVRAIDRRMKLIDGERKRRASEFPDSYAEKYAPLVGTPMDELKLLSELKAQIQKNPDVVLTKRLRDFVDGERARRPEVERVAGDELRPTTIEARRFGPAGELLGTRERYSYERAALDLAEEKGGVSPALKSLDVEIAKPSGQRDPGAKRLRGALLRVARDMDSGDFAPAREAAVARFRERTQQRAAAEGLGQLDPVYVMARGTDLGGSGQFATGGAEHGAVARSRQSGQALFRAGFRDVSDRAYELGIQSAVKRSVQWRMVNELVDDLVPGWGRQNSTTGFTRREVEGQMRKLALDPQDWVAWNPKRVEAARKANDTPDGEAPRGDLDQQDLGAHVPLKDVLDDKPNVPWDATSQFFIVPRAAFEEMRRGTSPADRASRVAGKFTGLQSQAILGTMPAYALRQTLQNVPVTLVSVGDRLIDPLFWRNLNDLRKARKLKPREFEDMLDMLGVRSRSQDAVRTTRMGSLALDVRRQEGALVNTALGLYGAGFKDYFVAPRKSAGKAGTARQVAESTAKSILTPVRAMRDANMAWDALQDRWARTAAQAAHDARVARGKVSTTWPEEIARSTVDSAKKMGPIVRSLQLPDSELAVLQRSVPYRRMVDDAAESVTRWLGDYSNYTQFEQRVMRAVVPFYGFARHSTRLLFYELPVHHPFSLAITLSLTGAGQREKERMFTEFLKQRGIDVGEMDPKLLAGYHLLMRGGGDLEVVDARWLNPLTGPLFEALSTSPGEASTQLMTPALKGALEVAFQTNAFTKNRLSNAQGQVDRNSNPLTPVDQLRVVANRMLSSLFPYRVWNDLANGDKGKLVDTSLAFDPQPYPYKDKGGDAAKRNQDQIDKAKDLPTLEGLLDQVVPLRGKSAESLISQAEFAAQAKEKGAKKKSFTFNSEASSGFKFK
jgi:hypothetical protein